MNPEVTKLIDQLAQKLGTTTEYLWSILLKQAPVSATVTLIQIILIIITGVFLFRLHKHLSNDDNKFSYYNSDAMIGLMAIISIVWAILCICGFFAISDVVNGYFNPEFWALDYIMDSIK